MSFFGNDAINRVNLHATVQALAQGMGGLFVFVYLLKAGVAAPLVLMAIAAMVAARFLLRPLVLIVARGGGLRTTLVLGTVLEAAIFPLLTGIHGPGVMLIVVIAVGALGSVFYWTSLHAYFASVGDAEHRGRQVGAREAGMAMANIVAPGIGGWGLTVIGPTATFALVALVQLAAIAPLIGAPNPPVVQNPPGAWPTARLAVLLQACDGWFAAGFFYLWQIALFVTLGERFAFYGGAMAAAGLTGAAASLLIGRLIDFGHGRASVWGAYGVCALVVALMALSARSPALAILANALAMPATLVLTPVMMTPVYNLAKLSPCPLRFHMATEGGWDIGCGLGCLAAAALLAAHASLSITVLLALAGAGAGCALLLRAYRNAAAA